MSYENKTIKNVTSLLILLSFVILSGCATQIVKPPRAASELVAPAIPEKFKGMLPFYRAAPFYPRKAIEKGLEGWVAFKFDVDVQGKTKNIVLLDSSPLKVFDRSAERAISQYRYKPYIEDGKEIEAKGLVMIVSFALEKY